MGGDYSRERFNAKNDFHGILQQQGRVQLDANWNEWVRIVDRHFRAETVDIVGRSAVPRETPKGFLIQISGTELMIGPGRIYVDGLLAENRGKEPIEFDKALGEERGTAPILYKEQPYLAKSAGAPREGGPYLVYLDVWEREVTYLERPTLIEQAIGIDTITALQTVWQVRVLANVGAGTTCSTPDDRIEEWQKVTRASAGRLSTKLVQAPDDKDPCLIPAGNAFRALENQLYRIEIHDGGPIGKATFKWSRENGSVATNVLAIAGNKLTVGRIGRDQVLRFNPGDWVEIMSDDREFDLRPGEIRKIKSVVDATQTIELESPLPAADFPPDAQGRMDPAKHTRIRRWDQRGKVMDAAGNTIVDLDAPGSAGLIPVPAAGASIVLEGGIQLAFTLDPGGNEFRIADYWTFAGRPIDGTIDLLEKAPPRGAHHHYCRLAIVTFPGTVADCRVLWPPVAQDSLDRGIHIKNVLFAGGELRNDVEVGVAQIAEGINVICDSDVDRRAIRGKPVCFVTLDIPYPFNRADMELWGSDALPVIGFQPLILAADVIAEGPTINWRLNRETRIWLVDRLLPTMMRLNRGNRVLAHLTLKGNFIWDEENPERPSLYLDGEAFGFRRRDATNTDIRFPSGDGKRGGDFEMWFWLVAAERPVPLPINLVSITVEPAIVVAGRSSRGVITLSGPAPAGGAVVLLSSGNNAAATVPESVTVEAGSATANFEAQTAATGRENVEVAVTASFAETRRTATLTIQALAPLLKVAAVRIVAAPQIDVPEAEVLAELENPRARIQVSSRRRPNAIQVQFTNARVDARTVVSGKSFVVTNNAAPDRPLEGIIVRLPETNSVRWAQREPLRPGEYRVTISGDGDSVIRSETDQRLDGEPQDRFPSGNDEEGGDFVFRLRVTEN